MEAAFSRVENEFGIHRRWPSRRVRGLGRRRRACAGKGRGRARPGKWEGTSVAGDADARREGKISNKTIAVYFQTGVLQSPKRGVSPASYNTVDHRRVPSRTTNLARLYSPPSSPPSASPHILPPSAMPPPARSSPPLPRESSTSTAATAAASSDDKALPSLNELFPGGCSSHLRRSRGLLSPEDLFRGSLPHPGQKSAFQPLSAQVRAPFAHLRWARTHPAGAQAAPTARLDPHAFTRGERPSPVIAGRSHPRTTRAHTPPPHTSHTASPCSAACCHPGRPASSSSSATQILPPSHVSPAPPRGWSQAAISGPAHPPYHLSAMSNASTSGLLSPADEVVSAITASANASATGRPPHFPHGLGPASTHDLRARPLPHDYSQLAASTSTGAGTGTSGRGKPRYVEAPPAPELSASPASARGKTSSSSPAEDSERRHCCPHCNKRFNRPSSLAIHVNTHTGAKRTCPTLFDRAVS